LASDLADGVGADDLEDHESFDVFDIGAHGGDVGLGGFGADGADGFSGSCCCSVLVYMEVSTRGMGGRGQRDIPPIRRSNS
jgi:hypothetical protein